MLVMFGNSWSWCELWLRNWERLCAGRTSCWDRKVTNQPQIWTVWTSSEQLRHLGSSFTRVAGSNLILLPLFFWSLLCDLTFASPPPSSCWRSRRLHFKLLFPPPAVPFLPTVVAYCALICGAFDVPFVSLFGAIDSFPGVSRSMWQPVPQTFRNFRTAPAKEMELFCLN